jgi:hypothetical protein
MTTRLTKSIFALALTCAAVFAAPAYSQEIFADDFESGDLRKTQGTVKWSGSNNTSVTTQIARSGTRSLRFRFEGGSSGADSWAEQRFNLGQDYKELYIEFYAYYPNGSEGLGAKYVHRNDTGTNNNKFVRVWKGDQNDGNNGYSSYWIKGGASTTPDGGGSRLIEEYGWNGSGVGTGPGSAPDAASIDDFITAAQLGKWTHFKVHVKAATTGQNNGVIEVWRDGAKLASSTNLPWYPTNGQASAFNYGYLLGWANSGFASETNVYIDDVRITTSSTPAPMAPTNVSVQ